MLVKRTVSVPRCVGNVKIVAILTLSAMMSLTAVPAYANTSQIQTNVKIKAEDLQTDKGIQKVYKRLQHKAKKACAGRSRDGKPKPKVEAICQGHLMDDFIESVSDPNLTEYHQSMTG